MIRSRYMDEWVGLVVIASVVVFLGVALQAGFLRDWFKPTETLRILLPEAGVAGLSVGADVEVLGTRAGTITRVVIDPRQQMHAQAAIDEQATAFIRRDSRAVIRKRFGVAGAAYVDIQRGDGPELDWNYAVIQAETERAPTETVGALIDEVRAKIFPVLDDAGRAMNSLAVTMKRVEQGEGNIGRLLSDDTLVRDLETTVGDVRRLVAQLEPAVGQINELTKTVNAPEGGVPELLRRADQALTSLQSSMRNLSRAAERTPRIARNVESATENIPSLLTQTQQTARELEQALAQLRRSWLLGGNAAAAEQPSDRLPATEVRP